MAIARACINSVYMHAHTFRSGTEPTAEAFIVVLGNLNGGVPRTRSGADQSGSGFGISRRKIISDPIGREKVGCCCPSAVGSHAVNHAGIHISKQLKPVIFPQAAPSERLKKQPRAGSSGRKCIAEVACLPDSELGGDRRCPARLYSQDIVTMSSCCQGENLANLGKSERTGDCCKHNTNSLTR